MRVGLILILLSSSILFSTSNVCGQNTGDAAEKADNLRLQLLDVQAKEAALQERLRQLDEDLKPENIERALAGIGSTRPEELREQRRRQLQLEKDNLLSQLGLLEKNRSDLESAIATAEIDAYHQSARGTSPATFDQLLLAQLAVVPRWLALVVLTLAMALGIVGFLLIVRRLQRSR